MSSTVSCSSAAASVVGVMPSSARIVRHRERVGDVGVAALALLALVGPLGDGVGPLDDRRGRPWGGSCGRPAAAARAPGCSGTACRAPTERRGPARALGARTDSPRWAESVLARGRRGVLRHGRSVVVGSWDDEERCPPAGTPRSGRPARRGSRARRRTRTPTTSAPARSSRSQAAAAVPPVARTSSTTSTRSPRDERVGVHLDLGGAVLQVVGDRAGLARAACRPCAPARSRRPARGPRPRR